MNYILRSGKATVNVKKSIYVGKFSIIAEGDTIHTSKLYIKFETSYIKQIYEWLIRGLLASLFKRNGNFKEGEYVINAEEILNKEFVFYIYKYKD